ncbi:hypothetical protein E4U48_004954 [Claviceps purpurea]|nr:hypothetical protein E4U48_004954 [Claviceps purpurea]
MENRKDESDGDIDKSVHAIADRLKQIVLEMNKIDKITGRGEQPQSDETFSAASAMDESLESAAKSRDGPKKAPLPGSETG